MTFLLASLAVAFVFAVCTAVGLVQICAGIAANRKQHSRGQPLRRESPPPARLVPFVARA
jgi:hypothetical protein